MKKRWKKKKKKQMKAKGKSNIVREDEKCDCKKMDD